MGMVPFKRSPPTMRMRSMDFLPSPPAPVGSLLSSSLPVYV
jgi:hypothetical protein